MKSLRRLIVIITFTIILILSSISLIDQFYIKPINKNLNKIDNLVYSINENKTKMNLQLRVLNNVFGQLDSLSEFDEDRKDRILDAYNTNYDLLIDNSKLMDSQVTDLLKSIDSIRKKGVFISEDNFNSLSEEANELDALTSVFINSVSIISIDKINTNSINNTLEIYEDMNIIIDKVNNSSHQFNQKTLDSYMLYNRIMIISVLLILFILAALIYKLVWKDFEYVIDGVNMLNRYDYNVEKLPKTKGFFQEEKLMYKAVTDVIKKEKIIDDIKVVTSGEYMLQDTLEKTFEIINEVLDIDRIGLAFVNYHSRSIVAEHGVFKYNKILLGPGFEVKFDDTTLSRYLINKKSHIMKDIEVELSKRPESASLNLLKKEGIKSNMTIPLIINDTVTGFIFLSSTKVNNFDEKELILAENIGHEISTSIYKTYLTQKMLSNVAKTFADIVEKKDYETGDHINRMTIYSKIIAKELLNCEDERYRVDRNFINDIENNAAIHDIGKVGIPDRILKKPGKLDSDEWEVMKQHTVIGAEVLTGLKDSLKIFNSNFYERAIDIAKYHHEKWDGTGYPEGLSGHDIPLVARIIAIADVFDAVSSKRVYKEAFSFESSVDIINRGSGTHFDPVLVKCFNTVLHKIRKVYDEYYIEEQKKVEIV